MKRIMLLVGVILVIGAVVGYGEEKAVEAKSGEIDWVRKYEDAFNKGDINGALAAAQNIIKQKMENVAFDRLLAIAKDKKMASESNVEFRAMTMGLIANFKDERSWSELKNIAEDKEQTDVIRACAIQQLPAASKDGKVFDYLILKLHEPIPMLRSSAANGLAALGNIEAGPYLMPFLNDEDEMVRIVATMALGTIKYEGAVDGLIQEMITKQEKETMKGTIAGKAAEALGQIGDEKAIEPLISILLDKNQEDFTRYAVSKALVNFKDPRVVDALIKVVEENGSNSIEAAEALGEIGDIKAIESIKKAIKLERTPFATKKYKEAYKKITGEEYAEQE